MTESRDCVVWFQDSSFKIQVSSKLLPNIFPCLEGSTERSDGSLGRSLRKIVLVAWDGVSGTARATKDGVSGQFSENIKQGECDSP